MNDASGLQSHTAAAAISSGCPSRLSGCGFAIASRLTGSVVSPARDNIGVSMNAGQTALMRMWLAASSSAPHLSQPEHTVLGGRVPGRVREADDTQD